MFARVLTLESEVQPISSGRAENAQFVAGEDDLLCTVSEIPGFKSVCSAPGDRDVSGEALGSLDLAGEMKGIIGLLEGIESDFSKNLADITASDSDPVIGATASATAGESERIIGLRERYESDFPSLNSSGCLSVDACARLPAVPAVSASASLCASAPTSFAVVVHARSKPMHVAHNSWSDTVRVQGPTGARRVKGGVSSPAEDLLPVSELKAGVPFPGGNQAQVPGVSGKVRSHLPSTRRFLVSNSCHLDTDWTSGNR